MKKQMKWGLATLILLLGIAAVFLFIDKDTETEPEMTLGQATKKLLEEGPQQQSPPLPGTSPDGERHNGSDAERTQSDDSVFTQFAQNSLFWELSAEDQETAFANFYRKKGLKPPPNGYTYLWPQGSSQGMPKLDENGEPILHKLGEPQFIIETCIGFAPTREQYERYKQLDQACFETYKVGNIAEYNRLNAEREALREGARGELPSVSISGIIPRSMVPTQEAFDNFLKMGHQKARILEYELYRKAGFDYLIPDEYR